MVRQNTLPSASPDTVSEVPLADALRSLLMAQEIVFTEAELRGAARTWERLAPVPYGQSS